MEFKTTIPLDISCMTLKELTKEPRDIEEITTQNVSISWRVEHTIRDWGYDSSIIIPDQCIEINYTISGEDSEKVFKCDLKNIELFLTTDKCYVEGVGLLCRELVIQEKKATVYFDVGRF